MPRANGKPLKPEKDGGDATMDAAGMAHMARTKIEKKAVEPGLSSDNTAPDYPYGLRLSLEHDMLKKIGMDKLPEVGHEVHLRARAHVRSAHSEKQNGGEDEHSLELQITHLGIHHAADGFKSEDQTDAKNPGRKRH